MFLINLQLFGGRGGSSGGGGGSAGGGASTSAATTMAAAAPPDDFPEAFQDGVDLAAAGWVNHTSRTVSNMTQQQWDAFTAGYEAGVTNADYKALMKEWDSRTGELYGYVRTSNSFAINRALYDPNNAGKTDAQIFTRRDRSRRLRDLETVQTLDRLIGSHTTQKNASYTRFTKSGELQSAFGLSDSQTASIMNAGSLSASELATLNASLSGHTSFNNAYTSTSANRSMNAFSRNPIERKINVPSGVQSFGVRRNAQESEVIFGRRMETRLTHISIASDGHVVLHEQFVGYR